MGLYCSTVSISAIKKKPQKIGGRREKAMALQRGGNNKGRGKSPWQTWEPHLQEPLQSAHVGKKHCLEQRQSTRIWKPSCHLCFTLWISFGARVERGFTVVVVMDHSLEGEPLGSIFIIIQRIMLDRVVEGAFHCNSAPLASALCYLNCFWRFYQLFPDLYELVSCPFVSWVL